MIKFVRSLRGKIILSMVLVSALVLGGAVVASIQASREASRGQFLNKHYKRFDEYRRGLGRALATTAAFIASDPTLRESLATGDVAATRTVFSRAIDALHRTASPDLIVLVGRGGDPIDVPGSSRAGPATVTTSRLVADVRNGMSVLAALALWEGHVYQVSAAPVRSAAGDVVGAVILGERLEKYLEEFKAQSDPDPKKQHRLTLAGTDGRVLASVFSADKHEQLGAQLQEENWGQAREGATQVPVIDLGGSLYDFHQQKVDGYAGGSFGELGRFFLMRTREHKQDELSDRVRASLLLIVFAAVAAIGIGIAVSYMITRPVQLYIRATDDLAQGQGDLTRRLDDRRHDEFGRLASNLNAVFAHIHDLAAKVQRAAFQVGASSAEISAASKQMLEGAQEQARKTESSTAAITELSASIQQVAENAMEATRVAKSSGAAAQESIERMNEIRSTVEEAAARIAELGESGKRIGNIVEVIRQISDQTTLLALNAAIEAAHAGEQGRGFAVVADEVSSLAKRVGQSARDIEDLIATIKEQTAEAVRAMSEGTREVEAGTDLVARTLSDLQKLVQVVQDTATAVQEQAVASDEIARNMDVVQRIAQDVLGASEEAVAQGDHLHRLAHGLEESVKGFRIQDGAGAGAAPATPAALPESTKARRI